MTDAASLANYPKVSASRYIICQSEERTAIAESNVTPPTVTYTS